MSTPLWLDEAEKLAPIGTATIAFCAACVAVGAIFVQRSIARKRAALDFFLKTETDKPMLTAYDAFESAIRVLDTCPSMDEFTSTKHYADIRAYLNIHELIAVGVKNKALDDDVCYHYWCRILDRHCRSAQGVIEHAALQDSATYSDLKELDARWGKKLAKWRARNRRANADATSPTEVPPAAAATEKAKRPWWQGISAVITGLITLIGLLNALVVFWPRITVNAASFDGDNGYAETFKVTNTGWITLDDVKVSVGLCNFQAGPQGPKVEGTGAPGKCTDPFRFFDQRWFNHRLQIDEQLDIPLSDQFDVRTDAFTKANPHILFSTRSLPPLEGAEIIIYLDYTPWIIPWHRENGYRFQAQKESNGKILWRALPIG